MIMKRMTVGEFKTHFSEVLDQVRAGEQIEVTRGKKKEVVGYFQSKPNQSTKKRNIGILNGKGTAIFKDNWEMTEEELLGL
jgi:hypothetical protein